MTAHEPSETVDDPLGLTPEQLADLRREFLAWSDEHRARTRRESFKRRMQAPLELPP